MWKICGKLNIKHCMSESKKILEVQLVYEKYRYQENPENKEIPEEKIYQERRYQENPELQ